MSFDEALHRVRTKNQRAERDANANVLLQQFGSVARKYFNEPSNGRLIDLTLIEQKYNALFA